MEIFPLANIQLHCKDFDIVAEVGAINPKFAAPGVEASVVVLGVPEFKTEVNFVTDADAAVELVTLGKISKDHRYQMPVADFVESDSALSWYGESPLLWTLCGQDLACSSIAFIATPAAVAYLRTRHVRR